MAAGQAQEQSKKREKKPPKFYHYVSVNGAEPVDLFSIPEPHRQEIIDELCDNFMAAFGYVPVK